MKVILYDMLDDSLLKKWKTLWEKSKFATFTNSPEWFIAADTTYAYTHKKILALYSNTDELIGIGAFVKERIAAVDVWTVPAREFADNESMLLAYNKKEEVKKYIEALSEIGNIYLTNYKINTLSSISNNPLVCTICADINHIVSFSENPYGNLSTHRITRIENKLRSNTLAWKIDADVQEKESALDSAFAIEKNSSKLKNGKGVFDRKDARDFYKNLLALSPKNIILSLFWMQMEPIAYSIAFKNKDTMEGSQKAHIALYNQYSPARLLIAKICDFAKEQNQPYFDFGRGDDDFKRSFSTSSQPLYALIISKNAFVSKYLKSIFSLRTRLYTILSKYEKLYMFYKRMKKGVLHG